MVAANRDDSNQIDARRLAPGARPKARIIDGLRLIAGTKKSGTLKVACELCESCEFQTSW